jgi:hypothetical protein
MQHLIGYKAYRRGIIGCLADAGRYVYFLLSRKRYVEIKSYPKDSFADFRHFVNLLHKFVPRHFFLRRPLPVPTPAAGGLAALGRYLADTPPSNGFLSLGEPLTDPLKERRC